ncbi:MAG: TIGR03619 family F420-dependent LLM class oxidoreductase [Deltaproteobacteria bacterium]|nr:TIGR03619 family F420-dependent LLM class oxidoreductase [Deltaproteobacteria bacterium]
MAVRIGIGLGIGGFPFASIGEFRAWLDRCEDSRIDSIWQSDRVVSRDPALEPLTLLSVVAGATRRLKLGTNAIVLPFHDPISFARQCATLDHLSDGRLLPTVAVGREDAPEWAATGRSPKGRGEKVDEALEVMTRLWSNEVASFEGKYHSLREASISPRPKQSPLPLWIGGDSPGAIRRTARFGHGWLAPLQSPQEAARVVAAIRAETARVGRAIPEDHYGATFLFRLGPGAADFPSPFGRIADPAMRRRFESVQALGDAKTVLDRIREFRAGGITKLIAIPLARDAAEMNEQSRLLSDEVIPHANEA